MCRFEVLATEEALQDAGLLHIGTIEYDKDRIGMSIGVGMSGVSELCSSGYKRVSPALISSVLPSIAASLIAFRYRSPVSLLSPFTARGAGAHAIADGLHAVQRGDADVMIVGGAKSCVTDVAVSGCARAKPLASRLEGGRRHGKSTLLRFPRQNHCRQIGTDLKSVDVDFSFCFSQVMKSNWIVLPINLETIHFL